MYQFVCLHVGLWVTLRQCSQWQTVKAASGCECNSWYSIHRALSMASHLHFAQDQPVLQQFSQTKQHTQINDSCIAETTLSLYNQSHRNSVIFTQLIWCNFMMMVHISWRWVCCWINLPWGCYCRRKIGPTFLNNDGFGDFENMAPGCSDRMCCFTLCWLFVKFGGCCFSLVLTGFTFSA